MAGAVVIRVAGELDVSTAAEFDSRLTRVVESGPGTVIVLDFSDVCFLDARCTAVIVSAWAAAEDRGRQLRVRGLHGIPARVFALLGLESMVEGDAGDR